MSVLLVVGKKARARTRAGRERMTRIRVLSDGEPDNFVVVDENGDLIEGVIDVDIHIERGKKPTAKVTLDGLELDVRAEIKRLTET